MNIVATFPSGVDQLIVNGLHQWDYGRKLEIHSDDLPALVEVHFACAGMDEAVVRSCPVINGVAEAVIPDHCLEQTTPIAAWIYEVGETSGTTVKTVTLTVTARAKPQPGATIPTSISDKYTEALEAMNAQIETLKDGTIIIQEAMHSRNATNATEADHAASATRADTATEADHAASATRADTATEADHATNASSAAYATNAGDALRADKAQEADHALGANSATLAHQLLPFSLSPRGDGVYTISAIGVYAVSFRANEDNGLCGTSFLMVTDLEKDTIGTLCGAESNYFATRGANSEVRVLNGTGDTEKTIIAIYLIATF